MRPILLTALMAGCGWNSLPHGGSHFSGTLWDSEGIVATSEALFVPLVRTGGVAIVRPDGTWTRLDLGVAQARDLTRIPGTDTVAAFTDTTWCDEDDPREARGQRYISDCPEDRRVVDTEVVTATADGIASRTPVARHLNALAFSPNGSFAIAYLDASRGIDVSGVVNLTEIEVLDLDAGGRTPVRVGFAADRVLFTDDSTRAVVLSQSEVAVVDLTRSPPEAVITFPLTLDPDQMVDPVGVDLTPDGSHALISVAGTGDLYVLDLDNPAVNLVSLAASPADMHVDEEADETLLVYTNASVLDVLDHTFFDTRTVDLDEPMDRIAPADGFAVLYGTRGQKDVYRYDYATRELVEYRLQNPSFDLRIAPSGAFAVAFTGTEGGGSGSVEGFYDGRPGMEIIDLRPDQDDTIPYALDGFGVGAAFDDGGDGLWALVLQQGVEYLWKGELFTGMTDVVQLSAPPVSIGAFPGGGFFVTHTDGFGLITFYDAATDSTVEVAGFALDGFLDEPELAEAPQ